MVNLKNLSKAFGYVSTVKWIKQDGINIILTDYFIFKTSKDIEGSALTALLKIFKAVPKDGEGLSCKRYDKSKDATVMSDSEIETTLNLLETKHVQGLENTKLTYKNDKTLHIFKAPDSYVFLDARYVDLVNLEKGDLKILGYSKLTPVYFTSGDEAVMLLPVRCNEPKFLKEV